MRASDHETRVSTAAAELQKQLEQLAALHGVPGAEILARATRSYQPNDGDREQAPRPPSRWLWWRKNP